MWCKKDQAKTGQNSEKGKKVKESLKKIKNSESETDDYSVSDGDENDKEFQQPHIPPNPTPKCKSGQN